MEILAFLIPVALIVLFLAIALFFWFIKAGQLEDLEKAKIQIFDEDE